MSKTVPTTYAAPTWREVLPGELIKQSTWTAQAGRQHHQWSRVGARVPLLLRNDTGWETTSTTYTTTDSSSAGRDLDTITGCLTVRRDLTISSSTQRALLLRCFGQDVDVRATVYDVAADASLGTIVVSCAGSGGGEWSSASLVLAVASWGASTPKVLGLTIEAKTSATTGYLMQCYAHEVIATAAQLPTG